MTATSPKMSSISAEEQRLEETKRRIRAIYWTILSSSSSSSSTSTSTPKKNNTKKEIRKVMGRIERVLDVYSRHLIPSDNDNGGGSGNVSPGGDASSKTGLEGYLVSMAKEWYEWEGQMGLNSGGDGNGDIGVLCDALENGMAAMVRERLASEGSRGREKRSMNGERTGGKKGRGEREMDVEMVDLS